jgi:hypothetical protein
MESFIAYISLMSEKEIKFKYNRTKESIVKDFESLFTIPNQDDKSALEWHLNELLRRSNLNKHLSINVKFRMVPDGIEGNSYFTLDDTIFIPQKEITEYTANYNQNKLYNRSTILVHELMHVHQRIHQIEYNIMYDKIGFSKANDTTIPDTLKVYPITNPDDQNKWRLVIEKESYILFMGISEDNWLNFKFRPSSYCLTNDNRLLKSIEVEALKTKFFPDRNLCSPNEIFANYFSMYTYFKIYGHEKNVKEYEAVSIMVNKTLTEVYKE